MDKMYPLIYGNSDYKNRLAFMIYDFGSKGCINSIDLEEFSEKILPCNLNRKSFKVCECPLYKEVKALSNEYVRNNILSWT